jgi:nucleoside-diphosphate-sugar epimerase
MSIIPQGSNVLVTGANGFLASHVVDQFLSAGYKVRGAVRSEAKGQWLVDHFTKAYGPGCFELAIVSDMSITGSFDEALTGISGIAHVASDVTFSSNVGEVMSTVEGAIKSILESAMKMPDIKRFVLTSSSVAAVYPFPGQTINVTKNSWNDYSMAQAYETNEEGAQLRGVHVYSASKVAAERALWKFVQERKPSFVANAVLPDFISGKVIGRPWGQQGSTGGLILDMYTDQGEKREAAVGMLNWMPPRKFKVQSADRAEG